MGVNAYALTTRQRLKDFLVLGTTTSTQDTILDIAINVATDFIEKYCARRFKETTYTEYYDGHGNDKLILKQYPVSSSASFALAFRTSGLNEDNWDTLDSDRYFLDSDSGIVYMANEGKFTRGRRLYRVIYTAGYNFNNSTTFLSDTPGSPLELVAWRLSSFIWNGKKDDPKVQSERIGDYSVSFAKAILEDDVIKNILDKFAKVEMYAEMTPGNIWV